MDEDHRKVFYQGNVDGQILGDDHFAEKALAEAPQKKILRTSLDEVLQAVCEHNGM